MREVLFPARWLYQSVTGFRNLMFDWRVIKAQKVDAKVISVGNLTMGGTGKTPITLAILEELRKRSLKAGVVSRGYKREQKGVLEVDVSSRTAAQIFGDEPALIKSTFPDIPVLVGERRVAAAQSLLNANKVDFIVCDDAFQHRRLHRDLNILLLDATEPQRNYRVLPVGRARESMQPAFKRADLIVVTKTNLIDAEELKRLTDWLESKTKKPIVHAEYEFKGFRQIQTGKIEKELKDNAYLVSGIAKPQALEKTLEGKVKVVKHRSFPDHHRYTSLEVEEIMDESSQLAARWILTTAKDSMKLAAFPRLREWLWVSELGIRFKGDVNAFYEAIDRLAREGR
ncbi:MAG: tetraacyldisaccharide 4'-kinase [Bdellovibrionales bacterium]|nr:tetraacyldisaccharide 4'-kinase [Bdellovibrionales bacterium]